MSARASAARSRQAQAVVEKDCRGCRTRRYACSPCPVSDAQLPWSIALHYLLSDRKISGSAPTPPSPYRKMPARVPSDLVIRVGADRDADRAWRRARAVSSFPPLRLRRSHSSVCALSLRRPPVLWRPASPGPCGGLASGGCLPGRSPPQQWRSIFGAHGAGGPSDDADESGRAAHEAALRPT